MDVGCLRQGRRRRGRDHASARDQRCDDAPSARADRALTSNAFARDAGAKQAEIAYVERTIAGVTQQFGVDAFAAMEANDQARVASLFAAAKRDVDARRADVARLEREIEGVDVEMANVGREDDARATPPVVRATPPNARGATLQDL